MRTHAFAEVLDGLQQRSAAVLIVGMGGNGKTSLAREIASACLHEHEEEARAPRFDAAVWVSDKDQPGTTNLSIVLDTIARTLDYPGFTQFVHGEKQHEVEQLLRRQRVLLIVDNFETITDGALLTWLLRLPEPSKALITSREYSRAFRNSTIVAELRGMTVAEVRALIEHRLRILRIEQLVGSLEALEPLIMATGGNPKALELTLGLVKYERRPLQQIVDDLYAARGEIFSDLFARAWALLDEAARRVLMVATFFPTNASGDALSASADVQGFALERAIERLADMSLIDVQITDLHSPPRYALHPLVRAFAEAKLKTNSEFETGARDRWVTWYLKLVHQVGYCPDNVEKLSLLDLEEEATFWAMKWAYQHQYYDNVIMFCHGSMYYYYVKGMWDKWFDANDMRLRIVQNGDDFVEYTRALAYNVQMLSRQAKTSEATNFRQILEQIIAGKYLPEELFFLVYHCIGAYALALDDFEMAEQLYRKILSEPDRLSHYRSIACTQWLGLCLYYQGQRDEARALFQQALQEAYAHNYGRYILFNQTRLASIELDEANVGQASVLLAQSTDLARRYHDREQLAFALRMTARMYKVQGIWEQSRMALTEAIDLFERMGMRRELTEARQALRELDAEEFRQ